MVKNRDSNITEIEDGIKKIVTNPDKENFIDNFLSYYTIPKASITRAKRYVSEGKDFTIKNKLLYREVKGDVVLAVDTIEQEILNQKSKPRYIMATDFHYVAAVDTKTRETLNISIQELPTNADFFLAWNGIEKADYQAENLADRKAAERFAKLYDVIAKDNPNADEHAFNLFLIRVLFLLFAEDTSIMKKGAFTNVLKTRTKEDGSNFNDVIRELFEVLDISTLNRSEKPEWLLGFPYVNGKLFGEKHANLLFSKVSRQLLIEAGEMLNWNEINPDILGAMIQSVASAEDRHVSGMHYTSISNIMKVINPLFLNELNGLLNDLKSLYEDNEAKVIMEKTRKANNRGIVKSLYVLLERISNMKFLDPACGSGNFLIIAYKELRRLEIKILLLIDEIQQPDTMPLSSIQLNNFNGIEIDDFAHEVARLSLWIAEHQMNEELKKVLPGVIAELLPLKDAGNIVQGNALRIDWNEVLPFKENDEVYVLGNPPYIGADKLKHSQKCDLDFVFDEVSRPKLDYISGWFYLGSKYIASYTNTRVAFVSTNSLNQGSQVEKVWERVLGAGVQIYFAYQSFKWNNSAKNNANVIVSIIGLSPKKIQTEKRIYFNDSVKVVDNINAYLVEGPDIIVKSRRKPLSNMPNLIVGSRPNDSQQLILEKEVYKEELKKNPRLIECTRKYIGGKQFTTNSTRYCIWLPTYSDYEKFKDISFIEKRITNLKKLRLKKAEDLKDPKQKMKMIELSNQSFKFQNIRDKESDGWFIPQASSGARDYIPMGYVNAKTVIADPNFILYEPEIWQAALLMSKMHMVWVNAVSGKLKEDYRYSAELVYNTFPIKGLSTQRKNEMTRVLLEILDLREYEGGTLAELYSKSTMPENLRKKHEELDGIVDRAYQQRPFDSDEERLATLLKLYQEMTVMRE
ncbi:class I SAM-dependent DNA methyltransferase [Marinilactibacillus psychrotolerans]|uniref:class I SAM-dependent DNA methyltransferase n=1 Tax=Marinilactibacillus psychrotolerans TaxID=191770 RepID=UPI00380BD6BD